jgi:anion-transporting  ArsA/GET3 family ATPase
MPVYVRLQERESLRKSARETNRSQPAAFAGGSSETRFVLGCRRFELMSSDAIAKIIDSRKVIITAGAGGVGKTTTAAAMAVAAAKRGRRVLCLTIDPARRLAESLGLKEMSTEATRVEKSRFDAAGIPLEGELTAMMLDTKRTFDEFVLTHSSSKEKAERLLNNKLYKYMSTSLAGTQEYMAMEKLVAVRADPRYDLVVLDTPPTANALDFLDAPDRLVGMIDSAAVKWMIDAFQSTGKLSLNILARSAAAVLRGMAKITGTGFLEALAEFLGQLNDLFGGFKQRADMVKRELRSPEVAFVLVTSPSPPSIQEALFFSARLEEHGMPRGAFIVNRFHLPPAFPQHAVTNDEARAALAAHNTQLEDDAPERVVKAHADAVKLAGLDAHHMRVLEDAVAKRVPLVRLAALSHDVHSLPLLDQIAESLMTGGV